MPQTRFVLKKAFQHELRPIVVINKIDRPDARAHEVLDMVFDLFVELGADDETLDFPVLYASGRAGDGVVEHGEAGHGHHPGVRGAAQARAGPARGSRTSRCRCRSRQHQYSDYVGRIGVGRIYNGVIKTGQQVVVAKRDGSQVKTKVVQVQATTGWAARTSTRPRPATSWP